MERLDLGFEEMEATGTSIFVAISTFVVIGCTYNCYACGFKDPDKSWDELKDAHAGVIQY